MRKDAIKVGSYAQVREPAKWENGPLEGHYQIVDAFTKPGYRKVWAVLQLTPTTRGTFAASDLTPSA